MDFQNNQISDLLRLFNNNKRTILVWLANYLTQMALPKTYTLIMNILLHMYVRMLDEKEKPIESEEAQFSVVCEFLTNNTSRGSPTKCKRMLIS